MSVGPRGQSVAATFDADPPRRDRRQAAVSAPRRNNRHLEVQVKPNYTVRDELEDIIDERGQPIESTERDVFIISTALKTGSCPASHAKTVSKSGPGEGSLGIRLLTINLLINTLQESGLCRARALEQMRGETVSIRS